MLDPAPDNARRLRSKFKRLLPTVGCEAEAVAYVEEAADVWQVDGGTSTKPVTPSGGYVRVEACLAAPDGQTRLRVVVTLLPDGQSKEWAVVAANVTREAFDGPYNGGVELCGCSPNKTSAFVDSAPTTLEELAGDWRSTQLLAFECSSEGGPLELQPGAGAPEGRASSLAGAGALLLPPGVWVGCRAAGSSVDLEMGALREASARDVAVCSYRQGRLHRVVLASETK
ncbi:hypothetical protein TSOC_006370 [Tetrabaena socialis]|uniref:Uncharacterized protein n=1 Tax=Tetrabaena socialis TaxID=47790 RepID=A0A2J8A3V8_9CHLO|nr:hypothetical protein TSOC_006370 [Tetrabaena socialis]|eukprot:PNH07201.1 hypothetical protein TSOC_006370 [Tetrabaena socialis]